MTSVLRQDLSFCVVEDRFLFLDLTADRYFCLSARAEKAFRHLCRGELLGSGDRERLSGLGLLGPAGNAIAACRPPDSPATSLVDRRSHPTPGGTLTAMACLVAASFDLRWRGLAASIARLRDRKVTIAQEEDVEGMSDRAAQIAHAFRTCSRLVSVADRCLPQSLAVAHRLAGAGARAELVLGVKLRPFKAHAWVQWRDALVNERLEVARLFTPILVI